MPTSLPAAIGNDAALDRGFRGTIDELRISKSVRSADWVAAEALGGELTTLGAEEPRP